MVSVLQWSLFCSASLLLPVVAAVARCWEKQERERSRHKLGDATVLRDAADVAEADERCY